MRLIEERRKYEEDDFHVVKQYAWGTQYVDEFVWIGINQDPIHTAEPNGGKCDRFFWALHDVNYNVIGLTGTCSYPEMVERYEYTPYGQRTVYSRDFLLADITEDGDVDDEDSYLMSGAVGDQTHNSRYDLNGDGQVTTADNDIVTAAWNASQHIATDTFVRHPRIDSCRGKKGDGTALLNVDLCDIGMQGKLFDKEFGGIYHWGARYYHPLFGKGMQNDPTGYPDGNSRNEWLQSNPLNGFDPTGLEYVEVDERGAWWAVQEDLAFRRDPTVGWVYLGPVENGYIQLESRLGGGQIALSKAKEIADAHASMGVALRHSWPSAVKHALAGERTPLSQKGPSTISVVASGFGSGVRDYSIVVAAHVPFTGETLDRKAQAIEQAARDSGDVLAQVGYGLGKAGEECLLAAAGGKVLQVAGTATNIGRTIVQYASTPAGQTVIKGALAYGVGRESYATGQALYEGDYEAATLHGTRVAVVMVVTAKATSAAASSDSTPPGRDTHDPSPRSPVGSSRSQWVGDGNRPTNIGGLDYSGHAIDQMQNRGIYPSAVENTVRNGVIEGVGNTPGTYRMYEPVNNMTVILNDSGRIITVYRGHGG